MDNIGMGIGVTDWKRGRMDGWMWMGYEGEVGRKNCCCDTPKEIGPILELINILGQVDMFKKREYFPFHF
jgi:hypothetical protein